MRVCLLLKLSWFDLLCTCCGLVVQEVDNKFTTNPQEIEPVAFEQ